MKLNLSNIDEIIQLTKEPFVNPNSLTPKIIQFGTGVLLRGLPDYYIDQANKQGQFNGSIIVIKSTNQGDTIDFKAQNNLYTICIEGMKDNTITSQKTIVSCISDVLSAQQEWQKILQIACDPKIEFIISNTTESGIVEVQEDIFAIPPASFPGKLTALLYHRFKHLRTEDNGLIILPTELINNNGETLKSIVISLAKQHNLHEEFIHWIDKKNYFCNTLVDRIVPGKTNDNNLAYKDRLAISVEPYNLWAIEVKEPYLKEKFTFANSNSGIKLTDNINKIKELKLRLLNAIHTVFCPIALLANNEYVRNTFDHPVFKNSCQKIMHNEVKNYLVKNSISEEEILNFSNATMDRFRNPFINHKWTSIAQNHLEKWSQRVSPILDSISNNKTQSYQLFALSMAAYIKLHYQNENDQFPINQEVKKLINLDYPIKDILAESIQSSSSKINPYFKQLVETYYILLTDHNIIDLIP